jgi:glycosyltransferase involved in cell wall biosynthesis/GR25 family glycosyltransferase involved in LPS biosynthesis
MTSKPIICFNIGYAPDFNSNTKAVYGAELALKSLAESLSQTHDVYIFGESVSDTKVNNVMFINSYHLNEFMKSYTIDVMIVSRYINHFLQFENNAKKTYVWFHDVLAHPAWKGIMMPENGRFFLQNIMHNIDGIVVLTEWHKKNVLEHYNTIDPDKIFIIGNAIEVSRYDKKVERVKNRFIYTSNPVRGLKQLVNNFKFIKKEIPDAELFVYRGEEDFDSEHSELLNVIKSTEYIKFMGRVENEELAEHQLAADFWYYPTGWQETFCISALEALAAGCICVTTNLAGLTDTIGDRGILLNKEIYSEEYFDEALQKIVEIAKNDNIKEQMRVKSVEWAMKQTWSSRANEWLNLIGYKTQNNNVSKPLSVKLMCNWIDNKTLFNIYKRFCQPDGKWKDIIFTDEEKADFYCIINFPRQDEFWDPKKTILFSMEELQNRKTYFPNDWIIPKTDDFFHCFFNRNSIEWHLNKTYSELLSMKIEKTKILSSVTSSEYRLAGHVKRINMISYFVSNNLEFDLYGKTNNFGFKNYVGSLPFYEKDDGIFPYKYTIACENASVENYFTEKIVDAILGECLCFYYGCPNIGSYIDERAYILINPDDPKESLKIINDAIDNCEWEKRIDVIRTEKLKILNQTQLIPVIESIISGKFNSFNFYDDCCIKVLNLDRRADRWENFVKHANKIGLKNYERQKAVDGKTLVLNDELKSIFAVSKDFIGKRWTELTHEYFAGNLGCAVSHISMWKDALKSDKNSIILEDDVVLDDLFVEKFNKIYQNIKDDPRWDILYLGFFDDEYGLTQYGDEFVHEGVMRFSNNMRLYGGGAFGYVLTPKGADKLIKLVNQIGVQQPIDHFMIDHFDTLCVYKTVPHLVKSEFFFYTRNDTDIQNCKLVIDH